MHLIWDWNGTLVDDLAIVIECVNVSLRAVGDRTVDAEDYRNHFTRPVIGFYESLLGRAVGKDEWETLNRVFHEAYAASLDRIPLTEGALEALDLVEDAGWTQSILSMWREEDLVPCVAAHGLNGRMLLVQGDGGRGGGMKEAGLREHLRSLRMRPDSTVLIGDSLDDAAAAGATGVRCVLLDAGSHHRWELERTGAPVAASIGEAVSVALHRGP